MTSNVPQEDSRLVPFLKWAGGKRWLISNHGDLFPKNFNSYFEPFLGSAAVFFHLRPTSGILADKNSNLIDVYKAIRSNWQKIDDALCRHEVLHTDDYYYEEREKKRRADHQKAAQLIYLNRTCWNGLYRVNLDGKFNVPRGTKNQVRLPSDNFSAIAEALKGMSLRASDFAPIVREAQEGDFLFVDPPYTVKHNMNGFVKYNESIFRWADQVRLFKALDKAKRRGVQILVLNANHQSIRELYSGFGEVIELERQSVISGPLAGRAKTTELAIRYYGGL
ncbi:MAG: DNA methyltransferase [Alphaproteobacteria bacterium HGW-Alphaproteobacteria-12]|nr:MAG: DNA methyltransferase [Alphaproteobacteria bacterium HGW-Alphaproteobacteria-12]